MSATEEAGADTTGMKRQVSAGALEHKENGAVEGLEQHLVDSGLLAAFESALLSACAQQISSDDLFAHVAKSINRFGRQWEAGYIDQSRHRRWYRAAQRRRSTLQPHPPDDKDRRAPGERFVRPSLKPRVVDTHGSAIVLQSHMRGYLSRQHQLLRHESATQIQRYARGLRGRKTGHHTRRRRDSATELQRNFRGYLTRKHANKQHNAATQIQSVHRGGRTRAHQQMSQDAAVVIQAYQRGISARRRVQIIIQGDGSSDPVILSGIIDDPSMGPEQHVAAVRIQAYHRGSVSRQRVGRMPSCAVLIQALARGYIIRGAARRAESEAAAKIQALQRGASGRSRVRGLTRSATLIQALARGFLLRWSDTQQAAAKSLQRIFRGHRARAELEAQRAAAIKIQARIRGRQSRKRQRHHGQPMFASKAEI